jgi:hypothetical protein
MVPIELERGFGPHAFKFLPYHVDDSFHSARSDDLTVGYNLARAIAVGKDLKEVDRVPHFHEPRVNAEGQTEGLPDNPCGRTIPAWSTC